MDKNPRNIPTISPTTNPSFTIAIPVKNSGFIGSSSVKIINGKHINTVSNQPIKVVKTAF
jgi:hypothetical protein